MTIPLDHRGRRCRPSSVAAATGMVTVNASHCLSTETPMVLQLLLKISPMPSLVPITLRLSPYLCQVLVVSAKHKRGYESKRLNFPAGGFDLESSVKMH